MIQANIASEATNILSRQTFDSQFHRPSIFDRRATWRRGSGHFIPGSISVINAGFSITPFHPGTRLIKFEMGFPGSVPSLFTQPACRYPRVPDHIVFQRGRVASIRAPSSCFTCCTFRVIVFAVSTVEYSGMCGFVMEQAREGKARKRENLEMKENRIFNSKKYTRSYF